MSLFSEWKQLLQHSVSLARSIPAKEGLTRFENESIWATDVITAQAMQQESQEMTNWLDREGLWGALMGLEDPIGTLSTLKKGWVIQVHELALIRSWLYAVDHWLSIPKEELNKTPLFKKTLVGLQDPTFELRTLNRILTPSGEISERASPALGKLFAEARSLKTEIEQTLNELMNQFAAKGVLQDRISDFRDGRYVLAVKITEQSEVEGIVYDSSVTRQTVYIEPREVEVLNNRLKKNQSAMEQEIYKILEEVSKEFRPIAQSLEDSFGILIHWDMAQARARLARVYGGKPIQVSKDLELALQNTAHPLLWWAMETGQIIRNTMELGGESRTLLITGPNTGGKTVFLKTIGMATICARTGFLFPGTDRLIVPLIEKFFVDLGDAQSIEKQISSFSGHVMKFKEILEDLTPRSLVLLDELNSATDPQEGAALARAILENLIERGALLIATTHDPYLKGLALEDPRILNASMEFDESKGTPTFRMVVGTPGRSRALETAERLGLPAEIIAKARGFLSKGQVQFEDLLSRLEREASDVQKLRNEAQWLRDQAEKFKAEWEEKTQGAIQELLDRTRSKLRHVLEKAQDEVRITVKKIVEQKSSSGVEKDRREILGSIERAQSLMDQIITDEAPNVAQKLKEAAPVEASVKEGHEVGDIVRVRKFNSLATIMAIDGNKIKVVLGHPMHQSKSSLTMTLPPSDMDVLSESEMKSLRAQSGRGAGGLPPVKTKIESDFSVTPSIDLRGKRYEPAMKELETYLDRAFRSGRGEVTVVHGLGTGAIRQGTLEILKGLPYIKSYYDGGAGRGGDGATVVEFSRD